MTVNDLAQDLLIRHNSAVGLVDRLAVRDLVRRERIIVGDRHKVHVRLTAAGEKVLQELASVHRRELQRVGPIIHAALADFSCPAASRASPAPRKKTSPQN